MTLSAAAQSGWDYSVFDAQSAYLQSDGIKRLLLLRMPHNNPPLGTKPGQVFVATGSIYGTRDAGRAWYEHSKKVLEAAGFAESRLEQGLYYLHGPSGLEALVQCGLVCCLTHSPELLKTGRFDLSTIISWQSSTIKRVVRSTLAAEGCAVSEGLEPVQWFRHLLTEAHMARSSLKNVEKESLKRPAIVFTDSDSLANTVKKDVGQSHDKKFRIVVSMLREGFGEVENTSLVVADTLASRRSSDEDDGKGHPRLILQQSYVSTEGQEDLCKQNSHRKCLKFAAKRVSIAAHEILTPLFSFLLVTSSLAHCPKSCSA